jgi:hypothetical protein
MTPDGVLFYWIGVVVTLLVGVVVVSVHQALAPPKRSRGRRAV